jgi:hypothetical protein
MTGRKKLWLCTLFIFSAVRVFASDAAFVSGVYGYGGGWDDLPGVRDDITSVSAALEDAGFDLTLAEDVSKDGFLKMFEKFLDSNKKSDRLIAYFAGHGYSADGAGHIVLKGAAKPSEKEALLAEGTVPMEYFINAAKKSEAGQMLFVFDSCFSGVPAETVDETGADKLARQFITSGTSEQMVPDESFFRKELVNWLGAAADRDGFASELGLYLAQRVAEYSGGTQTPVYMKLAGYGGDFKFEKQTANAPVQKTVKQGSKAEKDRLIAVIKRNPHSPDAYKAMERLREIEPELQKDPPVKAPERSDRVTVVQSAKRERYERDEYPFVVIVPIYVPGMYGSFKAALKIEAKDTAAYKKLTERKAMLASVMSRRMEQSNLQLVDDVTEIRRRIRLAGKAAADWVCPGCIEKEPVIAGLAGL